MSSLVTDAAAERAAQAVIEAGTHWEAFKVAVCRIQKCYLTPNTIAALLADELDLPRADVRRILDAFIKLPETVCTVAA